MPGDNTLFVLYMPVLQCAGKGKELTVHLPPWYDPSQVNFSVFFFKLRANLSEMAQRERCLLYKTGSLALTPGAHVRTERES